MFFFSNQIKTIVEKVDTNKNGITNVKLPSKQQLWDKCRQNLIALLAFSSNTFLGVFPTFAVSS